MSETSETWICPECGNTADECVHDELAGAEAMVTLLTDALVRVHWLVGEGAMAPELRADAQGRAVWTVTVGEVREAMAMPRPMSGYVAHQATRITTREETGDE